MKPIKNIDDKLQPIDIGDEIPQEVRDNQATFRRLFRLVLATAKGDADRSLSQFDLGAKIATTKGPDLDLEDAEFKLLHDVVKQNPTELLPHFLAQVLKKLN